MSTLPQRLDWDSTFFGFPIARLEGRELSPTDLARASTWCSEQRIACLYLRTDAEDVVSLRHAAAAGFRFVDVRVTLDADLAELSAPAGRAATRAARPEDVPSLRAIAAISHTNSRFYADGRFARERCDELYATWIEKSVGGWAQAVLVAEHAGAAAGYCSIHVRAGGLGEIGLVGVAREAQGRGLGRQLVGDALRWMREHGLERVRVVTQGQNVAAQRLYQACGLRTCLVEYWHHRWFDPS